MQLDFNLVNLAIHMVICIIYLFLMTVQMGNNNKNKNIISMWLSK